PPPLRSPGAYMGNAPILQHFLDQLEGNNPNVPSDAVINGVMSSNDHFPVMIMYATFPREFQNVKMPKNGFDVFGQGSELIQRAMSTNDISLIVVGLLQPVTNFETISVAAALYLCSTTATVPDVLRFWTILNAMRYQCRGSLGPQDTTSVVARAILLNLAKIPNPEMEKVTCWYLQCKYLLANDTDFLIGSIVYGISALGSPVTTMDHVRIAAKEYEERKITYLEGTKWERRIEAFRENLSHSADIMWETLIQLKAIPAQQVQMLTLSKRWLNAKDRTSIIARTVIKLAGSSARYGASIASKYAAGITGRMLQQAKLLQIGLGDLIVQPKQVQPLLGRATVHVTLSEFDELKKCNDNPEPSAPPCVMPETQQIKDSISDQMNKSSPTPGSLQPHNVIAYSRKESQKSQENWEQEKERKAKQA
ncbi:hypothetical protein HDU87_003037, partial [Geranomyces variabilis]